MGRIYQRLTEKSFHLSYEGIKQIILEEYNALSPSTRLETLTKEMAALAEKGDVVDIALSIIWDLVETKQDWLGKYTLGKYKEIINYKECLHQRIEKGKDLLREIDFLDEDMKK